MKPRTLTDKLSTAMLKLQQQTAALLELEQKDDDSIHNLRQGIKRLRAGLRLCGKAHNKKSLTRLDLKWRALAKEFNAARDAQVALQLLDWFTAKLPIEGSAARISGFQQCHLLISSSLNADTQSPHKTTQATPSLLIATPGALSEKNLLQRLRHCYRKARKLTFRAQHQKDNSKLHRSRKWVKYLHYQMEILELHKAANKQTYSRLQKLGSSLGRYHDLQLLQLRLNKLASMHNANSLLQLECDIAGKLAADAAKQELKRGKKLAGKVFLKKPGRFIEKLLASAHWQT